MRTVIQRVSHASVSIGCHCKSAIQGGLLILLGIEEADNEEDIDWLCRKITGTSHLRRRKRRNEPEHPRNREVTYWLSVNSP